MKKNHSLNVSRFFSVLFLFSAPHVYLDIYYIWSKVAYVHKKYTLLCISPTYTWFTRMQLFSDHIQRENKLKMIEIHSLHHKYLIKLIAFDWRYKLSKILKAVEHNPCYRSFPQLDALSITWLQQFSNFLCTHSYYSVLSAWVICSSQFVLHRILWLQTASHAHNALYTQSIYVHRARHRKVHKFFCAREKFKAIKNTCR